MAVEVLNDCCCWCGIDGESSEKSDGEDLSLSSLCCSIDLLLSPVKTGKLMLRLKFAVLLWCDGVSPKGADVFRSSSNLGGDLPVGAFRCDMTGVSAVACDIHFCLLFR